MINNAKILEMLREATLSEEKPVGLVQTDKIKGQSKDSNKGYYKDVEKKMSAYEKASTTSAKDSIEEPKFNYEGESEKEYHDDMEIRNGMEMLNYDRKPSEMFTQRAKEAIEGSSNMGNNPEWANVFPAQKGFTGPDFGKNLVKTIERSKKKRDAATPTFDQFGDDIEEKNVGINKTKSASKPAVTKKPVAIGESVIKEGDKKTFTIKYWLYMKDDNKEEFEKEVEAETAEEAMENFKKSDLGIKARKPRIVENVPPRPIVRQQDNPTEPRQTMKRPIVKQQDNPTEPRQTMKRPIVRQQDNPVSGAQTESDTTIGEAKRNVKTVKITVPDEHALRMAKTTPTFMRLSRLGLKVGENIENVNHKQFHDMMQLYPLIRIEVEEINTENYNKTTNESKMKRIKFKKPFNGVETALNVIPESYKVDNKVFEITDGTEHYRVRWEGNLTEGKAVVLSSFHQEALNEDVAKIKHLMGFKSQDMLGNLKGSQRLTEDSVFFDMLKKSKQSLNEAEAKPDFLDLDKDGDKTEPMKKAAKDAKSTKKKGIQEYAPDYDDPFGGEPDMEPQYFDVEVYYDPEKIGEYKERGWLQDLIVINFGGKHWSKSLEFGSIVDYVKDPEIKKLADTVTEKLLSLKKPFKAEERDLTRLFNKDAKNISDMIYEILVNAINDLDVDWEEEDEFDWHTYQKDKKLESNHGKSIKEADAVDGGAQPQQNLKNDVEMLFNTIAKNANLVNKIKKINNPIEKSQFLVKVSELIGLDLNLFSQTVQKIKAQAKQQEQFGENAHLKKKIIDRNLKFSNKNDKTTQIVESSFNDNIIIENSNDNVLTIGEFKQTLEILKTSKTAEERNDKLKKAGKDVFKLGVGLIPIVGQLGNAVEAASVGLEVFNIFKTLSDPKAPKPKQTNDFMSLFQINPEVSALLDDNVEYDFIKYAETEIKKLSDDKPVPDFFKELQKFIQQKYSKEHNITKSMNLQK